MIKESKSLSNRGKSLAENPARIDLELFFEAFENHYHPDTNPDGAFPLNVAENNVTNQLIKSAISNILSKEQIPDWVLNYTSSLGHPDVREIIANFMQTYFESDLITQENIVFSAGAAASLEICSFVLANPGDMVVIPAPAYPMYTNDLGIKSQVERYDLQTHFHISEASSLALVDIPILEKTLKELEEKGKCFRLLLITTPDNPTGSVYSESYLNKIADWCNSNHIHLVVNEIYALSEIDTSDDFIKFDYPDSTRFSSFAKIMATRNSEYLHLVYALSKDFAVSGLRFGIVHSLNGNFIKALDNVNIPHMVSNLTQWLVGELFKNEEFIEEYIIENKKRITASYKLAIKTLRSLGIPYTPGKGGLFVWADFSKYLREDSLEGEMQLWEEIYRETGILLTPGQGFRHQKKGIFRIVHSAVPTDYLEVAMKRLCECLK